MCLTNQNARFAYITMATRLRNRAKINLVAPVLYFSDENEEQGSCTTVLQRFRRYVRSERDRGLCYNERDVHHHQVYVEMQATKGGNGCDEAIART